MISRSIFLQRTVETLNPTDKPWIAREAKLPGFEVGLQHSGTNDFVVNYRVGDGDRRVPGMRDKLYQTNRTLGVLSKVFSLAEVWGQRPDGSNPCRNVKRCKEPKHNRFLSLEKTERLGEVLREGEREMPLTVVAFRLLLLTGCRLSEIQFLHWEYVTDDCIELPDAKTGRRVVPLGPEARAVLADLPREDGNPWVIRGRLPGSHITDLQKPWRRIRARAELEDVRIQDLRHSYASRALALGESLTMIGKLLGHTQVQTTARYAHLARDSIQNAAARITGSIGGDLTP